MSRRSSDPSTSARTFFFERFSWKRETVDQKHFEATTYSSRSRSASHSPIHSSLFPPP